METFDLVILSTLSAAILVCLVGLCRVMWEAWKAERPAKPQTYAEWCWNLDLDPSRSASALRYLQYAQGKRVTWGPVLILILDDLLDRVAAIEDDRIEEGDDGEA